jgi:two-component system nitrate/nitrite response regulator NarL
MRILICDRHLSFAESLAHALTARGDVVVGMVARAPDAARLIADVQADLCVVSVAEPDLDFDDRSALQALSQRGNVVVLAEAVTPGLSHSVMAAGVRGLAEMRQGMDELLGLIDRVASGTAMFEAAPERGRQRGARNGSNDAQRLAAFLSPREREVLSALVRGDDTATIARSMGISRTTARSHVQSVLTKLGAHTRLAAVTLAVRTGLVSPKTGIWATS